MPEKVTILNEHPMPLSVAPGVVKYMVAITYAAQNMFPRTVYIPQEEDSEEERRRVIAEDLEAARKTVPPTLEVP